MNNLLLQNRKFLFLWLIQISSTLGFELFNIAVIVSIFEQTNSIGQASGVMIVRTLSSFLIGPFAGSVADRYPRKWILFAVNLFRAILVGLLLLLIRRGEFNVIGVYFTIAGLAVAYTVFRPAQLALIPSIMAKEQLPQANGLMLSTNRIMGVSTYVIGGWFTIWFSLQTIIGFVIIIFILGALLAIWLPSQVEATGPDKKKNVPMLRAFREGLNYIRGHNLSKSLIVMETLEHWPHAIWTGSILLAFTERALNKGADAWGYQISSWNAGQILGAFIVLWGASMLKRWPGWIIICNAFASGILTLIYAGSSSVIMAVLVSFTFGIPSALRDVAQDSLLQGTVNEAMLGRIYATREMLRNITFVVSILAFAWLADQISIRQIYVLGGLLYIGTAVYALASNSLRHSKLIQEDDSTTSIVGDLK